MYAPTTSLPGECLPESIMVDKESSSLSPLRGVVHGIVAPDVTRTGGGKVGGGEGRMIC